jgi:hypothetical protein
VAAPADAEKVLSALRLGWFLAEVRGRNKPCGPLGTTARMPDHDDNALPLRIERSATELRIEAQAVVAQLARCLKVDTGGGIASFGKTIDDKAKRLDPLRAPKACAALQRVLQQLQRAAAGPAWPGVYNPPSPVRAIPALKVAISEQQKAVAKHKAALAAAEKALAAAGQRVAQAAGQPAKVAAAKDVKKYEKIKKYEEAAIAGEEKGAAVLRRAITGLEQPTGLQLITVDDVEDCVRNVQTCLKNIADAASAPWEKFSKLLWDFDAHIQDRLSATSETQACAYQLGRGLAETYWALDTNQPKPPGSASWEFLLSESRCAELSRLAGRLAAYMDEYTAPAIAGSLEVWRQVATTPTWRRAEPVAEQALYRQTRRWYELIILRQDPTTLIEPTISIPNYRTLRRAIQLFWPQLVATVIGLAFLALLILLGSRGGAAWAKTLSGILAAVGFSLAGLTGALKNSAQAMLKRLRQDTYTDLVAIAVQTAPPPPQKSDLRKAISKRRLTPATPN